MDWIVIMAGGGGTRLWPLSRRRRPKQFLSLLPGGTSLLSATVERTRSLIPLERTIVVTAAGQVEEVRRAVPALSLDNVVVEPEGRNTAPCIGLACVEVLRRDPEAILGVLPSDQYVRDQDGFRASIEEAFACARSRQITVIGIPPTAPETGFGYIHAESAGDWPRPVTRFVEKPDLATAERYLASGDYLWNAGMFFFQASRMLAELSQRLPELGEILSAIERDAALTADRYPHAPKISIDYAVIEKLAGAGDTDLVVVRGDFGWNDVGSFAALHDVLPLDAAGNATHGSALAIDARDNVLVGGGKLVAAVGVSGLCVIVTDDAVLVLPRERAQEVRRVVQALEDAGREPYL